MNLFTRHDFLHFLWHLMKKAYVKNKSRQLVLGSFKMIQYVYPCLNNY